MTDEASLQLQSIPGPLPVGGEKRRRWGTEGCGGGVWSEREKWMRGKERNWEESPQQNFCSTQAQQTGLSPVLPACLLSCCTTNCCCCCVKIIWRKQRRLSAWEKMDGLIRTWCRPRTSLIILILLHVAAAQSGKVSSLNDNSYCTSEWFIWWMAPQYTKIGSFWCRCHLPPQTRDCQMFQM